MKLPTADETKNLGTRQTDYAAQVELERAIQRFTPFVTLGYRWLGDAPTLEFRNQPYGIAGVAYKLNDATSVDTSLYWSAPSMTSGSTAADISAGLAHYLTPNLRLTAYVLAWARGRQPRLRRRDSDALELLAALAPPFGAAGATASRIDRSGSRGGRTTIGCSAGPLPWCGRP